MSLTYESEFSCPYCMAPNAVEVDASNNVGQAQIIDCQICCQPIELSVHETNSGEFEYLEIRGHR